MQRQEGVDLRLGTRTGVERVLHACRGEERARLLAHLHPVVAVAAVAPLMQQRAAGPQDGECSYTWKLTPPLRTTCVAALLAWAQERFDLDRPIASGTTWKIFERQPPERRHSLTRLQERSTAHGPRKRSETRFDSGAAGGYSQWDRGIDRSGVVGCRSLSMLAREYWKLVTVDRSDLLDRLLGLVREQEARFCVIGGQGVNAYVDPVVSLDLDLVIAVADLPRVLDALPGAFRVERFPHSVNISAPGSDLRVQIQTDPRYAAFLPRAAEHDVLGVKMPVAAVEDVLQGKVWAAMDDSRRPSKRQKDLADIARLLEARPGLRARVPQAVLDRLF